MLTPHATEPNCRRTKAGTETNIKAHGQKTAKSPWYQAIKNTQQRAITYTQNTIQT